MSYGSTMRFLRTGYAGMIGGAEGPSYLCDSLCTMRAAYLTYRNAHWQIQGPGYYGYHEMLENLYDDTKDYIDRFAEQIVGSFGPDGIREDAQIIGERVTLFAQAGDPLQKSLAAALMVQQKLIETQEAMRQDGMLTPGWDAVITETAAENDHHIYLLQQAIGSAFAGLQRVQRIQAARPQVTPVDWAPFTCCYRIDHDTGTCLESGPCGLGFR